MPFRIRQCVPKEGHPIYRGTGRADPYYVDSLDGDHAVNRAFIWYCHEGEDFGDVQDLTRANELVQLYRALEVPEYFEIVQVVDWIDGIQGDGEFLGYDISTGYSFSLLETHLEVDRHRNDDFDNDEPMKNIQLLLRLLREHFQPLLNINGLFSDGETAAFCLACMMALQWVRPNLWEADEVVFHVVGLWSRSSCEAERA